ncbi:MAG: sulfatase-like hydrolase/transferase, partial [Spirochaetia bacterium]|nr:sulfatase-like hydrolase/transferase [Spirochaetia bacterium]
MKRPNILWIMSDQHHAEAWGRFRPEVKTPNLDALARDGAVLTRAYCNNPICAPSRVSFITGQYPHTHGIMGNDIFHMEDRNPDTLSSLFQRSGYQTALIGKGHMVRQWDQEGFEHIRYCDLCDTDREEPLSCHYFKYLKDQGLADQYDLGSLASSHPGSSMRAFTSRIPEKHSVETWTGDETLSFLESRDASRPFFVQMSFQRPHEPLTIPSDTLLSYDPTSLPLPASADDLFTKQFAAHHPTMRAHATLSRGYPYRPDDKADLQRQLAHYYSLVTAIDAQIGRVVASLKKSGDYDSTVIVYHADHGDFAGDHGLMLKNMGLFE